ncbi:MULTISPECIES: AAA family ATPase [Pirellulaceae]|nr:MULTISPECIES: AAA family ATPase [Pirellulaceae]
MSDRHDTQDNLVAQAEKISATKFNVCKSLLLQGYNLIPSFGKKPLVEWKKYQTKRVKVSEVKAWMKNPWEQSPINWLLLTGHCPYSTAIGVAIVDADDEEAVAIVEKHCPHTPLTITTSRGKHFVYRMPKEHVACRGKTTIAGTTYNLDIKADGGYVVTPGSQHQSGHIYRSSQPWTQEVLQACPVYDPSWIPHETKESDLEGHGEYTDHNDALQLVEMPVHVRKLQAKQWLSWQKGAAVGGSSCSGYCLKLAIILLWEFGLPVDDAEELLYEWGQRADQLDENGNWYPWSDSEIRHKIKSAIAKSSKIGSRLDYDAWMYHRLEQSSIISYFEIDDVETAEQVATEHDKTKIHFFGIGDVVANAANQKEDWVVPNWLEFGSLGMLTGDPFSGKSCITAELTASICKWGKFGPYDVPRSPVLLIDMENKDRIIARRLERALEDDYDALRGRWSRVHLPEDVLPLDAGRIESLICHYKGQVGQQKPLVIIDTFRSAFDADEMDVASCKQLLYPLQRVAQRQDAAILILHHRPKSGAKYSGQTAIPGALDYLWMWDSDPEIRRAKLSLVGTRGDLQEPLEFELDEVTQRNIWVDATNDDQLESLVRGALKNGRLISQKELVAEIRNGWLGTPPGEKKTRGLVQTLVGPLLYRERDGHGWRYGLMA